MKKNHEKKYMITEVNFDASKNNSCTSSQPENKQTKKHMYLL